MHSRQTELKDLTTSEQTSRDINENIDTAGTKSIDVVREYLKPILRKIAVARKEENFDSIILKSSIRPRPRSTNKATSSHHEQNSIQSSLKSFPILYENQKQTKSQSSSKKPQDILTGTKLVSKNRRRFNARFGIGKSAEKMVSETNESLLLPKVKRPLPQLGSSSSQMLHDNETSEFRWSSKGQSFFKEDLFSQYFLSADSGMQSIPWSNLKFVEFLYSTELTTVKLADWNGLKVAVREWNSLNDEENTDMAIQEAKTLSFLTHPCVLSFYGIVKDGPTPGLVVEYLMHCSLKSQLEKMKGTETETKKFKIAVALKAALGVDFLHHRKVIHFDLKCENLLCDLRDLDNPIVKIGDFTLSKQKVMTFVRGNMRGTLPWMAPELFPPMQDANVSSQTITDLVNEKVDVYSFGVVLWEIWEMGARPYRELNSYELIEGIVEGTLKLQSPEHCDPKWVALMNKCLNRDPNERPDFGSIVKDLRKLQEETISQEVY